MWDDYVRLDQAARIASVSVATVRKGIKNGYFPSARLENTRGCVGRPSYEVTKRDVVDFIRARDERKSRSTPKEKNNADESDVKKLLTELHACMVKQTEILGKLIERL